MNKPVAIVTGASRGIGSAVAKELAKDYHVILTYQGNQALAEEVLGEIETEGGSGTIYRCDITDYDACQMMVDSINRQFGGIYVLVNNAGITKDNLLLKMNQDDFISVVNTNLTGAFNCIKPTAKIMMKQRAGKIINISSVVGLSGNAGQANYAASKAGIVGLTKSIAKELASRHIQVNAVAPGYIRTDMTAVLPEKIKEAVLSQIPLKRLGEPEDIAHMVGFLASRRADYITGQVFVVDGGMRI